MPPIKYKYNSLFFIVQLIKGLMSFLYSKLPKIAIILITFFAFKSTIFAGNLTSLEVVDFEADLNPSFNSTTYSYNINIPSQEINMEFRYIKENASDTVTITGNRYLKNTTGNIIINVSGTIYTITYTKINVSIYNQIFEHTGGEQNYNVLMSGKYKLEVWGAQGGTGRNRYITNLGGYGSYSVGVVNLVPTNQLFVNVGGVGTTVYEDCSGGSGGYNGGGTGGNGCGNGNIVYGGGAGGGGATHIATVSGELKNLAEYQDTGGTNLSNEILIVAGGGGGGTSNGNDGYFPGGAAGGFEGNNGVAKNIGVSQVYGGTQTSGASFGIGGTGRAAINSDWGQSGAGAGGGGWYGGKSAQSNSAGSASGGGGGSGYISSPNLLSIENIEKHMTCYNCSISKEESLKTNSTTDVSEDPISDYTKIGNGYAKITYVASLNKDNYLSSLTSNKGNFDKTFDPTITNYVLTIGTYESTVDLNGVKSDENAIVTGFGEYVVDFGVDKTAHIMVTSENGELQIYTVTIKRKKLGPGEHSSKLGNIVIRGYEDSLDPNFTALQTNYGIDILRGELSLKLSAFPFDEEAIVKIEGNDMLMSLSGTITITVQEPNCEDTVYTINYVKTLEEKEYILEYTGGEQIFEAPETGLYKLEVWGAQGGYGQNRHYTTIGGYGGYAVGTIRLNENNKLYINIGGTGTPVFEECAGTAGGYNGGGAGGNGCGGGISAVYSGGAGGGGATHIATVSGQLKDLAEYQNTGGNNISKEILIVAGGGGGGTNHAHDGYYPGGAGGGVQGNNGTSANLGVSQAYGATQTSGYLFGQGAPGRNGPAYDWAQSGSGGGGGGFYGGKSSTSYSANSSSGGAGGSGYISSYYLKSSEAIEKHMTCYNCSTSSDEETKTYSTSNYSTDPISDYAKSGNGAVKITYVALDRNNYLSILKTDIGTWNREFDFKIQDYTVTIDKEEYEINVEARPYSDLATIDGLGKYDIPAGTTDIPITVTAESGEVRVYNLHIVREPSSNGLPKNITISGLVPSYCEMDERFCNQTPEFDSTISDYDLTIPYKIKEIFFNVEKGHPYQSVNGEGAVSVKPKNNLFTVTVTSEDESKYTIYNYYVLRDMTGDADISKLNILYPAVSLEDEFDPDITDYYFKVQTSIDKYVINPTNEYNSALENTVQLYYELDDPEASSYVLGDGTLKIGLNQIPIMVVAKNGDTQTYTLNVYRAPDSNVYLSEIKVKKLSEEVYYELNPEYNSIFPGPYKVVVPKDVDKVELLASAESGTTSVEGTGTKTLQKGGNEFSIITTSQSGDVETYKINIYREKDDNANLAGLKVKIDDVETAYTPIFDPDELEYSLTTPIGASEVEFELTLESNDATYRLLDNETLRVGDNLKRILVVAEDGSTKTYTITITRPASDDNLLSALTVYNGEEEFLSEIAPIADSYDITVENEITWVNVLGTKNDKNATIVGNGKYSLKVGLNEIKIKVTSESGEDKFYTINVTRKPNSNAFLKSIATSVGTLSPTFDKETPDYTINVGADIESINIVGNPEVSTTKVTGNGNYNLSVGDNTITLVTLAEDNVSTLTYTIIVTKDKSNNANLESLLVKEGALNPVFNKNVINYTVRVPYDITKVNVLYVPEVPTSTVTINGGDSLVVGDNEVTVKVKAEDLTEKTYTINVIRLDESFVSNYLSELEVSEGTLTPVFDKHTLYYEVELPYETTSIWIDGEAEDEDATISGLGKYNLNTGENLILVRVTGMDSMTRDYQVMVRRAKNDEARLSNVTIKDIAITFDKDTYEYNVTTKANKLDFTSIVPMDSNAKYTISGNNFEDVGNYDVTINVTAENGINTKTYTFHVTREESNNTNLASLSVEGYTITPEFNPDTWNYSLTIQVENSVKSVNIIAKSEDKNATITGDGIRDLVVGPNRLYVNVKSEDNTEKNYMILVIKKGSDNNKINVLEVLNGTMTPEYTEETSTYNVTIPYSEDHLDLNIVLDDITANYSVVGNENLPVGNSTVRVTVTSESGNTRIINLNVTREEAVSALIKELKYKDYDLLPAFDSNTFNYNVVVDYEVAELEIDKLVMVDRLGTYEILELKEIPNPNVLQYTINTSSRDNEQHEMYKINIIRQAYANNFLKSLTTNEGDLTPEFDKYNISYSIDVPNDVETIELIGEPEDSSATVTGLGVKALTEGENNFVISVVKDGIRRNYKVRVDREEANDNYLLTLVTKVNGEVVDLTPEFDSKTYEYSLIVPASTETINFTGTVSNGATVTGLGNQPIAQGNNPLTITVTSAGGKDRIYKINVYRPVSTNVGVTNIIPSSGSLSPTFDPETKVYTLEIGSNIENLSFTVNKSDKFATVTGHESETVPTGNSQRIITITAEDGETKDYYTINIKKARGDNALLSNLYVVGYDFEEDFDPEVYEYHVTVANSKTTIGPNDVVAVSADPNAKITKQEITNLSTKTVAEYLVTVKSYDESDTKTYKIYVTREKSNMIQLDSLSVDRGKLDPTFTPGTRVYDLYVYTDETEVNITAEPANEDIDILSGTGLIPITSDEMEHKIILQAENGDTGFYTINIHRSILTDQGLSDLGLNHDEELEHLDTEFVLSPSFDTNTLLYEISVPYEYKYLDVFYEKMNNQQTVKIKVGEEYVTNYELVQGNNYVLVEVYDGLGKLTKTYTMKVIRNKSRNTYLKSLEIVGYELTPEFEKTVQEYSIRVPVNVTDLDLEDIIAIPEEPTSRVSISGYTYLIEGVNDLEITVISQDRSTRTYLVHVIRGEDKLSDLKNITVSTGVFWPLAPKFKSNVYDYTVTLPGIFDKATVEAVVEDSEKVDIEGIGEYPLVVGNNKVTLTSTSKITGQISVYTINIVKEANEDVDLVSLSAREGALDPEFNRATTKYHMTVANDVDKLTLSYETSARTAKVFITGNENFVSGDNRVTLIVTNFEGTISKAYQIIVTKEKNANPYLASIKVYDDELVEYPLEPEFDINERIYKVEVPETIDKVTIEAKPVKVTTTVNGTGETYLNYGNNRIKITTKAENGTEDEYYINIYRNYNLDLESITLSEGSLVPEFRGDITEYIIDVDNEVTSIDVVGAPVSNKVEVFGNDKYSLRTGDNTIILIVKAPDDKTKTYTLTVNRAKNSNNYIKELTVNGIIAPVFEKTIQLYDVDVRPDVTSLDLGVVLEAETSTYEVLNNTLSADNNPNAVTIRVTAENGDTRDYVLNVMVRDWSFFSNRLRDLKVDHGQLTPDFNADINNYAVTVPNSVDVIGVEAVKQISEQKVTINGIDGANLFVNLQVGRNVIPITVTDQFDIETSYYSLIVYRLEATDASLANLVVEGHQYYPYFNKETYSYNLNVGSEVKDLNVIATPTDPNSKVEITGNKNIPSGESQIKIKVTAPDNVHTKLYIINVTKTLSSNNYLTDIQVKDYSLNETFVKTKQGIYTLTVPFNVTNVLITGIPEVSTTTVAGDGVISLNKGNNTITLTATAENGDTRNYTLVVTRELSKNSSLADIILSDGDLDPVFNPETLEYEVEVDEEIEEVTVTGIPKDPNARVTGNGTYDLTEAEETTVDLVVTAEDGKTKTTYKVKFIRELNASAYLKSLIVKDGEIYPGFHKLIASYTVLVPNEVRSLNMVYEPEDEEANVEVTGNESFKLGTNKVHIVVTSKDNKNITDYEISVIRQSKGSNYLGSLTVTSTDYMINYPLNPEFDKKVLYYEVHVPSDVDTVSINAQAEDLKATLRATDLGVKTLNYATNRYYIQVESEGGIIRTYQVVIIKDTVENKLLTLESDKGVLSPTFDSDKFDYTLTIPDDVTELTLSGTASEGSSITGLGDITIGELPMNHTITVTKNSKDVIYTINIVRGIPQTNTNVNKLIPSSGTLSPAFTNDNDNYEVVVDDGIGTISFEVETEDDKATVTGNELTTIEYGENNITIVVTARDGETKRNIIVKVTRKKKLQRIDIEKTDIKLGIDEEYTIVYTLVPEDADNKEVEFISADENIATVSSTGVIKGIKIGTTTVKVLSKEDSNIYKIVTVRVLNKKITSSVYDIERFDDKSNDNPDGYEGDKEDIVIGLEPETKLEAFINNFDNEPSTLYVYDKEGNLIEDKTVFIGTGMTIKLKIDDVEYDALQVVVRGDLDGNGVVTMTDYAKMKNQLLRSISFNYVEYLAADVVIDETITMADYTKLKNYLLKLILSLNE